MTPEEFLEKEVEYNYNASAGQKPLFYIKKEWVVTHLSCVYYVYHIPCGFESWLGGGLKCGKCHLPAPSKLKTLLCLFFGEVEYEVY